MGLRIQYLTELDTVPDAGADDDGANWFVQVGKNSDVTITSSAISAAASDNSFNISGGGFTAAGFDSGSIGKGIKSQGMTGTPGNNSDLPIIVSVSDTKIVVSGVTLVDDAAGESVTLTQWETVRVSVYNITSAWTTWLGAANINYTLDVAGDWDGTPNEIAGGLDELAARTRDIEDSLGTASALDSDTDGALTANSDAKVATQKAAKTYADARETAAKAYADTLVVGLWDDRGNFDASVNAYPSSGGSGTAGAILKGDIWKILVAGTLPTGLEVVAGDDVRALTDTPGNTEANWAVSHNNTQTSVSGNAGTATALQTSRNIDGVGFNGTADITVIAPGTHAATGKTTPVDADELPIVDSAASNVLKKLTWANLKATAKAYFDTLYQALDSDLTTIAGLTATTDSFLQAKSSAWAARTVAQVAADLQGTGGTVDLVGFRGVPSNSQSAAYTTVMADAGKSVDHPSTDTNARTFTIDSNANVAYPIGTCLMFSNMTANVVTIAITSDTMYLAGPGTTGSRSLAQYGVATARKLTSTTWQIFGTGLT